MQLTLWRAVLGSIAVAAVVLIAAAGWAAFAPIPPGPREAVYVIPKGTAAPATFDFACSAHEEGQLTIVVEREPVAGWRRLRWRLAGLVNG